MSSGGGWIDYDYAVVRVVPRVRTGAFLNVGVVLHARREGFLGAALAYDQRRLQALDPSLDVATLERFLDAYLRAARGGVDGGRIGLMPPSERFHWLTAPRSGVIQTSPVHPGRCHDLPTALDLLLREQCG